LERIVKSGAKFDIDKAQWFNQHYMREKPLGDLINYLAADLKDSDVVAGDDKIQKVTKFLKDRIVFPQDLWSNGKFFFVLPEHYEQQVVQKKWNDEVATFLHEYSESINSSDDWNSEIAHQLLSDQLDKAKWGFGKIMPGLRLAITGLGKGPDLMKIMEILGKEETVHRLNRAITSLADITIRKHDKEKT
jgi:glutamyl-tRNA synthetase